MPLKDIEKRREYSRQWREKNRGYGDMYYFVNKKEINARALERYHHNFARGVDNTKYRWKVKIEVLSHYSGGGKPKCAKCGENDVIVLCIDHISGNGTQQRYAGSGRRVAGYHLYMWLRKNSYPEDYQVLCMNCNTRKKYVEYSLYKGED